VKFAPDYVSCVLNENFEDAKAQFLSPLMAINYAHLVMLTEQGIVDPADARAIAAALDAIDLDAVRAARYDGTYEDLFFYVERLIVAACGEEIAGRLHTARSRNDIDMTMYRMRQREMVLALIDGTVTLRRVLLDLAARHTEDVFPAHTHTQPAQPSTIAHYLMAVVEQLERDTVRLRAAYATTNQNPLGACAITGTGFPIDRCRTAVLLGFEGSTGNTYGSIATVDYLLESVSATAVLLVGLGRVVQDLLLWCTSEFGYLRLSEGFVQCSSIMPQKRNPVALEHARAIGSKAVGQASAVVLAVHNTPFGDIVDTEDDLQPLVFTMFRDAARAVRLVAAAMTGASFDVERMAAGAARDWITVTELADTLTREYDVPFRAGHAIASRLVRRGLDPAGDGLSAALREISSEVLGQPVQIDDESLARILSPQHFVEVRKTPGGPAPSETRRAIAASQPRLEEDQGWVSARVESLRGAELMLREAVRALAASTPNHQPPTPKGSDSN
jgi:argininosuccinate lyase